MQKFLNQLVPYIFLGVAVVAFAFGIMLLAYLFLFGAFVGLVLFVITWIKQKFFSPKPPASLQSKTKSGRVIDSDDWRKL